MGDETQKTINFGGKLSFYPVFPFFLSASTAVTYIFTAPTCTTTIINPEPRALNAEFQYFILSCSILYAEFQYFILSCSILY
jgi:hypothetical protein